MKKNKVVIIGAGMVGMSYAYSMVNQGTCEELVLIDIDKNKTVGEALDLNPVSYTHLDVYKRQVQYCLLLEHNDIYIIKLYLCKKLWGCFDLCKLQIRNLVL